MNKIVISGFDKTGNMVKPWAEAGYLCYCVDMQHEKREERIGNIIYVRANMLDWLPPHGDVAASFFFPPCTDVAVSGAKHFRDKGLGALIRALELFKRSVDLAEMIGAPYCLENPVSTVSSYWRKPDYIFHPHYFTQLCEADNYTKTTCLWTGGGLRHAVIVQGLHAREAGRPHPQGCTGAGAGELPKRYADGIRSGGIPG